MADALTERGERCQPAASGALLDRRLLFVTGKGGVGKTSVAAALAELSARSGRRTLVCEMDAKGALANALDEQPFTFAARKVAPQLWGMEMNTEDSLREYLRLFVKLPLLAKLGPLARTFDFVADAAPGVKEILAVGKLAYEVRERHYDCVIVDAEASGHIVSQVNAPAVIAEMVQVGLIRDQTRWMRSILEDATRTGVVVVTTPEEMPVNETLELVEQLRTKTAIDVAAVIANRVLDDPQSAADVKLLGALRDDPAAGMLADIAGKRASTVVDAALLATARQRVAAGHLAQLRAALPAGLPVGEVPELFARSAGRRAVLQVAEALAGSPVMGAM